MPRKTLSGEVVCRDIPGLNWYMPRTVIEVPKKNLGYQYAWPGWTTEVQSVA